MDERRTDNVTQKLRTPMSILFSSLKGFNTTLLSNKLENQKGRNTKDPH